MLLNLREYHRPQGGPDRSGLDRALALLARPAVRTVPLAGGDTLVGSADPSVQAVVDLQDLGLGAIGHDPEIPAWRIGAMATRAALAADERLQKLAGGVLSESARRWSGSAQRNRATVGGAIVTAAANDPLVAALLACDAAVVLYSRDGPSTLPLADFLPRRKALLAAPALVTGILAPEPPASSGAAMEIVARTPADAPIVVAVAALTMRGAHFAAARLALGGVAELPLPLPEAGEMLVGREVTTDLIADVAARASARLSPTGDYRGSAAYRQAMARVLAERALREAWRRAGYNGVQ